MIRKSQPADLPFILQIWLESNLQAHSFIPSIYWESHVEYMKQVLPQAELYVYEVHKKVVAFVGLEKDYIAGIFIQKEYRSQGIGKQLLDFLKKSHSILTLSVYSKNQPAIHFYLREHFQIIQEEMDTNNNEKEMFMQWQLH